MARDSRHSAAGRIGAFRQHARHDARATTAAGRAAFSNRFEQEVDPGLLLAPEERRRRAAFAKKAYFAALALRSASVRRSRADKGTVLARSGDGEAGLI